MKVFMFLVNTILWLQAFLMPAGLLGFLAFILYAKDPGNLPFSIIILVAGIAAGTMLAEHIRKGYGLAHFFGKLLSTPELERERSKHQGKDNTVES
jgi:hypothetical protein